MLLLCPQICETALLWKRETKNCRRRKSVLRRETVSDPFEGHTRCALVPWQKASMSDICENHPMQDLWPYIYHNLGYFIIKVSLVLPPMLPIRLWKTSCVCRYSSSTTAPQLQLSVIPPHCIHFQSFRMCQVLIAISAKSGNGTPPPASSALPSFPFQGIHSVTILVPSLLHHPWAIRAGYYHVTIHTEELVKEVKATFGAARTALAFLHKLVMFSQFLGCGPAYDKVPLIAHLLNLSQNEAESAPHFRETHLANLFPLNIT